MERNQTKQQAIYVEKVAQLRALGIDPYPAEGFAVNTTTEQIAQAYGADSEACQEVAIAGRLMTRRIMGAVAFCELEDEKGRIQLYIKRDVLCPSDDKQLYHSFFKKLLDIGDIVGVKGNAFITKMGSLAIRVTDLRLLTKAIRPLPVVKEVKRGSEVERYYTFSNPEHRYRQRYLDLVLNPNVRRLFEVRAKMVQCLRDFFNKDGYLEVETPILQPIYGGAMARPFTTHHNTLAMPLFLRISPELYLKRLIVGGYAGVYEFAKCFRNEGMSRFHNPEFTMVELYVAYKDYYWGMDYTERMLRAVLEKTKGKTKIKVGAHEIDFGARWERMTIFEAIERFTGVAIQGMDEKALLEVAKKLGIEVNDKLSKGKIIDEIFSSACEPRLIQPTFITDYPVEMSPLAKKHRDNPALVERFELICNGKEICNAYSELNDPVEQRKRLAAQQRLGKKGDSEAMRLDEDFLRALSHAMPPTFGWGLGIDRFAMLIADVDSIQEVILFPQMRKETL